jgi:hypothetical protein
MIQSRQQTFERERWIRGRMAEAVASFGAAATVARTVLSTFSWQPSIWDQEFADLVAKQIATVGQELVSVHVAFGASSTVTASAGRVHEALEQFGHHLLVLQESSTSASESAAWSRAHDAYEASGERLDRAVAAFADAARAEVFLAGATNTPQRAGRDGS